MTIAKTEPLHPSVPVYEVSLVRKYDIPYKKGATVESAASILHGILDTSPVEKLISLHMDLDRNIVGAEVVAIGDYDKVGCAFQSVFRGAIAAGVPSIILGHNHVTGLVAASDADLTMTGMALTLGKYVGVEVYDHIIVGPRGEHYSIFDHRNEVMTQFLRMRVLDALRSLAPKDPLAIPIV